MSPNRLTKNHHTLPPPRNGQIRSSEKLLLHKSSEDPDTCPGVKLTECDPGCTPETASSPCGVSCSPI